MRDRRVGQRRQPRDRDVDHLRQEIPLHRGVEGRRFVPIAHAEQQPGAFAMEIEGGLEVDHHDVRRGHVQSAPGLAAVARDEDVPADRIDRHVDAGHRADRPCIRAGRVDDRRASRSSRASSRPRRPAGRDATMPVTSTSRSIVTPSDCAVFAKPIVTPLGSAMPSRWQNVAARTPSGAQARREPRRLGRVEPLHVDAEAALQRDVALEGLDARRRRQQEQVAVLMEVDRVADFVGEALEQADRLDATAGCSLRSRTDAGRRRRCGRSIPCRASSRARAGRRR